MKVYGGASARRSAVDMQAYAENGYIDKAPHFNSVLNILENPEVTPILKALIEESAVLSRRLNRTSLPIPPAFPLRSTNAGSTKSTASKCPSRIG